MKTVFLFGLLSIYGCTFSSSAPVDGQAQDDIYSISFEESTSSNSFEERASSEGIDAVNSAPRPQTRNVFAERPDTSEGLVNVSADLEELLEFGELYGACEAYAENPSDRRLKLLCGKWMFFYEGFGTIGIPRPLLDWMGRNFPDEAGLAFTKYGLVQDPYMSTPEQPRHLGVGEGAPYGSTPTLALTCANCHFGQMPDGRYAVGYPNLEYEYGTHMLALLVGSMKGVMGFNEDEHHPDALMAVRPILDRFDADPLLGLGLTWNLLSMFFGGQSGAAGLSYENEGLYASWRSGTMDFAMAPLPIEDDVHTISKIPALWGIPTVEEEKEYGLESAMLAWTGAARSLEEFLEGFVVIGGGPGEKWGPEEMSPLREYLESLDAPEPLFKGSPDSIDKGQSLFVSEGCQDCHGGPRGGGLEVYHLAEIGTDPALASWGDADGDGEMCCGIGGYLTGGIKAPRLTGLYALRRYLHNGSLGSLEELLCLEERPPSELPPYANTGHLYGCELPAEDKAHLLVFLRSL